MDAGSYHQRGLELEKSQKYAEAVSAYTKAIALTPDDSALYMDRASALSKMKDLPQALRDLDVVIRLNPQLLRAYAFRAHINETLGDNVAAVNDYTNAIQLAPRSAVQYFSRGLINKELGRTLPMIDDYYHAVSLDSAYLRNLWGSSLGVKKKLEIIDQIVSEYPSHPETYALRTHLRFQADDYYGGVEDLDQALRLRPDDARFLVLQSTVFYGQDDWQSALADLNKALRIDPEFPNAYVARATNWLKLGEKEQALADLERAIQLDPKLAAELSHLVKPLRSSKSTNRPTKDLPTIDLARRSEQIVLSGNELPLYLQDLVRDALQNVRNHPSYEFLPLLRRNFYNALSADIQLAMRIEGWAAVIAARKVLPLFQSALPQEHSPEELIILAENLLKGQANRDAAQAENQRRTFYRWQLVGLR